MCILLGSNYTRKRLAAWGSLPRSPDPLAGFRGRCKRGEEVAVGKGVEGKWKKGKGRKGNRERGGDGEKRKGKEGIKLPYQSYFASGATGYSLRDLLTLCSGAYCNIVSRPNVLCVLK